MQQLTQSQSRGRANSFDLYTSISINHIVQEQVVSYDVDQDFIIIEKMPTQPKSIEPIKFLTKEQLYLVSEGVFFENAELAVTLIQKEIPFLMRIQIWMRFVIKDNKFSYFENYSQCSVLSQINRDVYRTHLENLIMDVPKYVNILRRILVAYANYDKEIGYTQGMNLIAGMLILLMSLDGNEKQVEDTEVIEREDDIFWMFVHLMKKQRDLFMSQTPGLYKRLLCLQSLLDQSFPELRPHLSETGIGDIQMCFTQYYLTMLMQKANKNFARFILEMYLIYGDVFLTKLIVGVLVRNKEKIMEMDDIAQLMPYFRDLMFVQFSGEIHKLKQKNQLIQLFQEMDLFNNSTTTTQQQIMKPKEMKERFWQKIFRNNKYNKKQ